MTEGRPRLRDLATALGVEPGYRSALDGEWIATNDATCEALVAAMGFDASSEAAATHSLSVLADDAPSRPPEATRFLDAEARLSGRRVFGLWANLYSVRSGTGVGFGHLGDLSELAQRAAAEGAAFVGFNPLHATTHRSGRFCPYSPVSRLYRDPLYLDPERIPELADCAPARRLLDSTGFLARISTLRDAERLDTAASEAALFELLRPLHASFRAGRGDAAEARRSAFAAYCDAEGDSLSGFVCYLALADHFEAENGGRDWRSWPVPYRDARSGAVRSFAEEHRELLELHAWIQFELEQQLAGVARDAHTAGLGLGLVADLALGSAAGGADTWSQPGLFADGVSVGAPPDAFSLGGQDWSFPPLDPSAMRRDGFAFFERLLDANLRHAAALRIDHALGLRRLFWIPEGRPPSDGAYVRQPESDLLARLADRSRRHGALVIAEDLGTIPPGFSEEIRESGMLSTRVLLFERDERGFRPSADYPDGCLASANTHDLPPLAALLGEADLALRHNVGQIPDDAALAVLCAQRQSDRDALVERLAAEGWLGTTETSHLDLAAAVTAFLCATPARLVSLSLDDLAGETEPINLPGVSAERHSSWTRRMRPTLSEIFEAPLAREALAAVPVSRRSARAGLTPLTR